MKSVILAAVFALSGATSALAYTAPAHLDGIPTMAPIASPDGTPDIRFAGGRGRVG